MAKKTAKKKTAKKVAAKPAMKKAATKKVVAKEPKAAKPAAKEAQPVTKVAQTVAKPRTKGDIMNILSESTGLTKKDVGAVFASLTELIGLDVGKKGPGAITIPGLMKIIKHKKPATKARKGVNPFTGAEMTFKAKPARNVVKVRALKALKEMVAQ